MDKVYVKCNHHPRALVSYAELPTGVAAREFDYLDAAELATTGEDYSPRFVQYRGSWYDTQEFDSSPDFARVHGFDAWQTQSVFSAVGLQWFDKEGNLLDFGDSVIVGYMHW